MRAYARRLGAPDSSPRPDAQRVTTADREAKLRQRRFVSARSGPLRAAASVCAPVADLTRMLPKPPPPADGPPPAPRRRRRRRYRHSLGPEGQSGALRPAGERLGRQLRRWSRRWARRMQRQVRPHRARAVAVSLLVGLAGAVLAWQALRGRDTDDAAWARVPPGASHDGIPLPAAHRLAAALPPDDDPGDGLRLAPWSHPSTAGRGAEEPVPANAGLREPAPAETANAATPVSGHRPEKPAPQVAGLSLRIGCAWGEPGRNPYRGTPEQVLAALRLPPGLVQVAAQRIRAGDRTDRATITSSGIRRHNADVEYDAQRLALSFGRSLCLDSRVNFPPGHREEADLYEVATEDGRQVTVLVPDVCGNVSVLSVDGQSLARLAFADAQDLRSVPAAGTLGLALLGLGLAAALHRRR